MATYRGTEISMVSHDDVVNNTEVQANMPWEVPRLNRCLFCFPLRQGLLAIGYINLLYAMYVMNWVSHECTDSTRRMLFRGAAVLRAGAPTSFAVAALDAVMSIVLLVGLHTKRILCLNLYLLYGALSTTVVLLLNMSVTPQFPFLQASVLFCVTVIQIYVLILIRSEVLELESAEIRYVKAADPEGFADEKQVHV